MLMKFEDLLDNNTLTVAAIEAPKLTRSLYKKALEFAKEARIVAIDCGDVVIHVTFMEYNEGFYRYKIELFRVSDFKTYIVKDGFTNLRGVSGRKVPEAVTAHRYWFDTENGVLYCDNDAVVSYIYDKINCEPDDSEKSWAEVDNVIEHELGFVPDYQIN